MNFEHLVQQAKQQYSQKLPFVIYSDRNSNLLEGLFQNNSQLLTNKDLEQDGFVMAPFDNNFETVIIPGKESNKYTVEFSAVDIEKKRVDIVEDDGQREKYKQLIEETIAAIHSGKSKKVVFSRNKEFPLNNFSIEVLIKRIFSSYPTAYRYVWYHPQTGIWCGATPEILLKINKENFETMALAGTQPFTEGEIVWRHKEKEEQQFVTDAIMENLDGLVDNITLSDTHSHRAGNLLHLRTLISGTLLPVEKILSKIAEIMHPTPAVCGTPQIWSRNYIIETEGYPREFYTGFMGPIEDNGTKATLMVNLRSMKIVDDKATVYVGGGVTEESDPEEEWVETQNKMQTMLHILNPFL